MQINETENKVKKISLMDRLISKKTNIEVAEIDEISKYLKTPNISIDIDDSVNIKDKNKFLSEKMLSWWKENSKNFPILYKIAKDYLSIMPTSVSSKGSFYVGSLTIDKLKSNLHPDTAQEILCLNSWNKRIY